MLVYCQLLNELLLVTGVSGLLWVCESQQWLKVLALVPPHRLVDYCSDAGV